MRIVILTYESFYSNYMTQHLVRTRPGEVVGIIRSDCLVYGKSLPAGLWYLLKRTGLRFVGRKALELFQSRATAIILALVGRPLKVASLREIKRRHGIPVVGSRDVNLPETLEAIRALEPDLVISVYLNQLIRKELIGLAPLGCLNIHPALLPRNRGLFPYFWVFVEGDKETGVTVHRVDEKFDTGDILVQRKIEVQPEDTITSLSYKSSVVGAELLVEAVELIEGGDPPRIKQDESKASYHSWPGIEDQRRFRRMGASYGTVFELMKYM